MLQGRQGAVCQIRSQVKHIRFLRQTLGRVAQSVKCLTADPGVASSIPARSHSFLEIDHEIIPMAILLPFADSRRVVVSHKRKYVHEVLVNYLVNLAQEKSVVK